MVFLIWCFLFLITTQVHSTTDHFCGIVTTPSDSICGDGSACSTTVPCFKRLWDVFYHPVSQRVYVSESEGNRVRGLTGAVGTTYGNSTANTAGSSVGVSTLLNAPTHITFQYGLG
eukprot:PhF_6_TR25623/c0_g1_i1/m.35982